MGVDIAIIAMNCRFPGANNIGEFWANLVAGRESVSTFHDDELLQAGAPRDLLNHRNYVKTGTKIDGIDLFDAEFFGFTPKEAQVMDPQLRHFLEAAWETFELAGYNPRAYPHRVGVYAGMGANTYLLKVLQNKAVVTSLGDLAVSIANDKDYLTTTVSYKLDLKGPSVAVHTACSTSLVAVHLACQSLKASECNMALAGGVALDSDQFKGYLHLEGGILSPDGHCRPFDANAQGTAWGQGLGLVLLKPVSDAVRDSDQIYAVIKGSAINNDGASKVGFTAPSTQGQETVIRLAHSAAGIAPETVSYVEAHGTGTILGDPIEMEALTRAFQGTATQKQFCAIGSVKSNIGHTDAAAGVAGLIKVALALSNEQIPPSLNCKEMNPAIDFENSPFFPITESKRWIGPRPLRAGVSSFGIGGTNAHLVLEQAPVREVSVSSRRAQLLLMSARTSDALSKVEANLAEHLTSHAQECLADVAYTLQVGRHHLRHRRFVVSSSTKDAITALGNGRVNESAVNEGTRQIVFAFPGQGAQSVCMAESLYRTERLFRDVVDHCAHHFELLIGVDLRSVLYPAEQARGLAEEQLGATAMIQPALFTIEYALAQLLMEWGIQPSAMIGHSLGEYVAACISGVMAPENAMRLVAERGRLMQQMERGAMLAVVMSESEARQRLLPGLSLAAVNAARQCTISGEAGLLGELETRLRADRVVVERLPGSFAFHSQMTDPILGEFEKVLKSVRLAKPKIPIVSSMTGNWLSDGEATDIAYWIQQARRTVRFSDAVRLLMDEAEDIVFLEITPRSILANLIRSHGLSGTNPVVISSASRSDPGGCDSNTLLNALGEMWTAGANINWEGLHSRERRRRISLPTYPFDRRRYWIQTDGGKSTVRPAPDKVRNPGDWCYVPIWKELPRDAKSQFECDRTWLIFLDSCGLGTKLAELLRSQGKKVICVAAANEFSRQSTHEFGIVPDDPEHYKQLWNELRNGDALPEIIVHLWSIVSEDPPDHPPQTEPILARNFFGLLYLGAVVGEQCANQEIHMYFVSNNLYQVDQEDQLWSPVRATLLGPARALNHEYQNICCHHIDISTLQDAHLQDDIVEELLGEVSAGALDEVVAFRRSIRWGLTFTSKTLSEPSPNQSPIKERGTYLITGGLGGIGLTFAKQIARESRAGIVIVGRSAFPSRQEWSDLVRGEVDSDLREKILDLMQIEQLGCDLMICTADVSDTVAMREVIGKIKQRFGAINGVIHAAGVAGGGVLSLKTRADAELVLKPKVAGTLVVHDLLKEEPLDFFVLCASLAGVLGSSGQVDYIAANAFQDAYAHWARRSGIRGIVSIDWDGWADVGMLASYRSHLARQPHPNPRYSDDDDDDQSKDILPKEGWQFLKRLLCGDYPPQIAVSTTRWRSRAAMGGFAVKPQFDINASAQAEETQVASESELTGLRFSPLEESIAMIWREMLGIDNVKKNDDFIALGGNSLVAIQIAARIRQLSEIDFTVVDLYEHPTIAGIASFMIGTLTNAFGDDIESVRQLIGDLGGAA